MDSYRYGKKYDLNPGLSKDLDYSRSGAKYDLTPPTMVSTQDDNQEKLDKSESSSDSSNGRSK